MQSIELVVHCYAKERPWYAPLFCYQFSSLHFHQPECSVRLTLFCDKTDYVLSKFLDYFRGNNLFGVDLNVVYKPAAVLSKRAIGRNEAALNTEADLVWFTDPDYVFGGGCLDALSESEWPTEAVLCFPHVIQEQYPHWFDAKRSLELIYEPRLESLSAAEKQCCFFRKSFYRAMGSIQIVRGDFARKHGYCPNRKQCQTPDTDPFGGCYSSQSDLDYRLFCKRNANHPNFQQSLEIPNVYRMSHPSRRDSIEIAMKKCGWLRKSTVG